MLIIKTMKLTRYLVFLGFCSMGTFGHQTIEDGQIQAPTDNLVIEEIQEGARAPELTISENI